MYPPIFFRTLVAVLSWAFIAIVCSTGSLNAASDMGPKTKPTPGTGVCFLGHLADETLSEASGMVASRKHKNLLWVINDGGNPPLIHAVGLNGSNRGHVRIRDALNTDWEDLAAFQLDGLPYLLIADCGDNDRRRKSSYLYIVEEPRVGSSTIPADFSVPWKWRIEYSYSDGPRDCEGVAVDMGNQQILLLTKRTDPPVIYALPLVSIENEKIQLARPLATIKGIPAPTQQDLSEDPLFGRFRSQPTAMDISPDGETMAILTYKRPYLIHRRGNESWSRAFDRPPLPLVMPRMRQAEALCFSVDGASLFVTSEKHPAPLYRVDIKH